METSNIKMVLKVGDILELSHYKGDKFHIINITEIAITYVIYRKNNEPYTCEHNRIGFESHSWSRAKLKWY